MSVRHDGERGTATAVDVGGGGVSTAKPRGSRWGRATTADDDRGSLLFNAKKYEGMSVLCGIMCTCLAGAGIERRRFASRRWRPRGTERTK